ncbi:MAG: peptidase M3 [Jatrophihabitans sp.]|nr:MAG: peptidase M3 [Jatrophihabitans sp.]
MTLSPLGLPTDPAAWRHFVATRADEHLARAREVIATLKDGSAREVAATLGLWNDLDLALGNAGTAVAVLAEVHPDEAVRTLAEDRQQQVSRLGTERDLDRDLYDVMAAVPAGGLDAGSRRLLEHVLRDFRRAGVDRDEATRARLREINERTTVLGQDFARNIRDDVRSITIRPEQLAGLPQDYIDRHPAGDDGLVRITTDYPDTIPFRTFATDAAARRALMGEFANRAWPANDALLAELLDLRQEQADLLGYPDWAGYDAEVKMIGNGPAIATFVDRIAELADEPGRRDMQVLLARKRRDDPQASFLDSSDSAFYSELVRREQFDVDAQQVRRYFRFPDVRAGLLEVTGRLFGVDYRAAEGAPSWHEDVASYDVVRDGEVLGRIHLDLHPREGKFKHAAQFDLVPGVAGRQLPEGVLVCNFSDGLMEHDDVVTLFHEFGHLVHHVLGGAQRYARFSGVATEWDFVEAPSQLLEEWAWDADVLRSFARDETGEPIPADLVARMRTAEEFGKGVQMRTQMFYAALAYRLHRERPADRTALLRETQQRYDLFRHLEGTHFHASFGHLVEYASAYYTYAWSLVIAKDLFSAFDAHNLFDPAVAGRYRDTILAPGGSADAADLVADFLGRPYSFEAFGAWLARPAS